MIGLGLIKDQTNWNFGVYNTPHIFRRLGSSESMMEVDDCPDLRLDGLPNELLLHIFQYLDVEFILQAVSKVLPILSATICAMPMYSIEGVQPFPRAGLRRDNLEG